MTTIKKLIEAGEKATQETWYRTPMGAIYANEMPDGSKLGVIRLDKDNEFVCQAANARPAIAKMYAENERLRAALESIREIYAGMDGSASIPETAPEGYLLQVINQTWGEVNQALKGGEE